MGTNWIKTNWCVITGAPSSGKTSVIEALAKRGYSVMGETARELIEQGLATGQALADIRKDAVALQRNILALSLEREESLDPKTLTFLDRGLPDSITYCRLAGIDTGEAKLFSGLFRYQAVFIFDRLPIVKDSVRTEDDALADMIDQALEQDYRSVGYHPIRVPVLSVAERTDFVLEFVDSVKTIPIA